MYVCYAVHYSTYAYVCMYVRMNVWKVRLFLLLLRRINLFLRRQIDFLRRIQFWILAFDLIYSLHPLLAFLEKRQPDGDTPMRGGGQCGIDAGGRARWLARQHNGPSISM
ncbi:hypothetical protein B0H12DRAFT_433737 [Mycena haematopus]|nr:hypothetical protein B0H12DRAFT_433737 [Mycena haematopus]